MPKSPVADRVEPNDRLSRTIERVLTWAALATIASVHVISVVYTPGLRQPARLIPFTALFAALGLTIQFEPEGDTPDWRRLAHSMLQAGLVFAIMLVSPTIFGLLPVLFFPVVATAFIALRLRLALPFTLFCLVLLFAATVLVGDLELALQIVPAYAGGFIFFGAVGVALVQQGRDRQQAQQLLAELETAHRRLQEYATQVEALAVAEERNRLAREIHDSLGHYLTAITRQLEAAGKLVAKQPKRAAESIAKAEDMARESLSEVRRSVAALRTSPLDTGSLDDAIADLVQTIRAGGIATTFSTEGEPGRLSSAARIALYRTAQEGLTNVRKHAKASEVRVDLTYEPHQTTRCLADNGLGRRAADGTGFGLLGLRERLALLGGSLEAENRHDRGFRLRVVVPTEGPADD